MAFLADGAVELVPLDPAIESHVEAYARTRNEPAMRATGGYGAPMTRGVAREHLERFEGGETRNAVCALRVDGEVSGWASVYVDDERARVAELAYYVLPDHQGEGLATTAARLLVGFAFEELNAHSVRAQTQADNPASERVLEKLGFRREGRRRDNIYKDGEYRDVTDWGLLEAEFRDGRRDAADEGDGE